MSSEGGIAGKRVGARVGAPRMRPRPGCAAWPPARLQEITTAVEGNVSSDIGLVFE
jgi:hypothetical protein